MIYALSPAQVEKHAGTLRPYLERGCASGVADPGEMLDLCLGGEALAWVILDGGLKGVAVTEVNTWPKGRVLRILCVAGDGMDAWLGAFTRTMRDHARANDCMKIVAEGRKGWGRVLGLKPARHVYEMEV